MACPLGHEPSHSACTFAQESRQHTCRYACDSSVWIRRGADTVRSRSLVKREAVHDDRSRRQLSTSEGNRKRARRHGAELPSHPWRVNGVVASQARPRCGERREHVGRLVVVEPTLHFRRGSIPEGRERLGVDCGTIVYDRKKQRPVRCTHSGSDYGVERFSGSAELLGQHPCTLAIPGGDPLGMRLGRVGLRFLKLHRGPAQCLGHLFERSEDAMWQTIHAARVALRPHIRETIRDNAAARIGPCRAACRIPGVSAWPRCTGNDALPLRGPEGADDLGRSSHRRRATLKLPCTESRTTS